MNHFYHQIPGWFTFPNLYRNAVTSSTNNQAHFVEIGSWYGQSAAFMAVEIINSKKNIKFDCIDTWAGSSEHENYEDIKNKTLYEAFLKNIEEVKTAIEPIRMASLEAAKLYKESSLDFVFIDAAHDYTNVKNDIQAWYPKVKPGGILAGHDYCCGWPEVIKAVNDFVLENNLFLSQAGYEQCWVIKK